MRSVLSSGEVKAWQPYPLPTDGLAPIERTRRRMAAARQWAPWQMIGRRMAIGCVALEITQRCNLDCSYCYLSESSEALKDIPIEEVFRRIDLILAHYGPNTDVQVTGGEPTLRDRAELVAIVRYIKRAGLRSSLFTNGIRADREVLEELASAGLEDVAFHVDMTQGRVGYASEDALNTLRTEYIERARGLRLAVIFNTTAYAGNFHELPDLVRFFVKQSDVVRLASFQVGADTGRGTERTRVGVDSSTVMQAIRAGAGAPLDFSAASAGHAECNGYAFGLVVNGKVLDFFNDPGFVQEILASSAHLMVDRADRRATSRTAAGYLLRHPAVLWGIVRRLSRQAWDGRREFIAARGKVGKISFFVHDFMDAQALDRERCEACSFMVMTPDGPMSMCVHNAKRDDYLLVPARVSRDSRMRYFNPATGTFEDRVPARIAVSLTRKNARGRAKDALPAVSRDECTGIKPETRA